MTELEELKKEFAGMKRRLAEQAGALDHDRMEQREALSLARAVMEQQASTRAPPATIYIPRDTNSLISLVPPRLEKEVWKSRLFP